MKPDKAAESDDLRRRAQARLQVRPVARGRRETEADLRRMKHELEVHQIELEMQNEELQQAHAEAAAALARYTDIYDFAPLGYFTLGRDGAIANANLTGARLLGLERVRLRGQRFGLFVVEAGVPVFNTFLRQVFAAKVGRICEVAMVRANQLPLDVRIEATLSEDGREAHAVVMDVTERKRAREEIRRLNTELEERVRQRTATIRRLSVELTIVEKRERTRLSHILHEHLQQLVIGAMFLLESIRPGLSARDRKRLKRVNEILAQSIQVARNLAAELSPPILNTDGLAAALKWLGRWMREHQGLKVRVSGGAGHAPLPEDLSFILFQAVRELLFNVLKHAEVKSAEVKIAFANSQVRIVVSDKGAGFDPAGQLALVSTTGKVGLFSVKERLALLDGQLEIESAPGRGTRFTLWVPLPEGTAKGGER